MCGDYVRVSRWAIIGLDGQTDFIASRYGAAQWLRFWRGQGYRVRVDRYRYGLSSMGRTYRVLTECGTLSMRWAIGV